MTYQVNYVANVLPLTVNINTEDGTLADMMEIIVDTEEPEIFSTKAVQMFFEF